MAARKSIAPQRHLHDEAVAVQTHCDSTLTSSGAHRARACSDETSRAARVRRCEELRARLDARLALLETVCIALQSLEEDREVAPISAALVLAVDLLTDAHEELGLFLEETSA